MSAALFQKLLYAAIALGAAGLAWRVSSWFLLRIGPDARGQGTLARLAAAAQASGAALFSRRLARVLRVFAVDVLLQGRLYAWDKLRWLGHLLIVIGFLLLLLMHALAPLLSARLLPGYQPTLDPYLWLRNAAGLLLLAGLALVFLRRWRSRRGLPSARRPKDAMFAALLLGVVASGFLLEADKIASPQAFERMAAQYADPTDLAQIEALRALWASEYGVAFENSKLSSNAETVERGRELHAASCAACHSRPASAFVSFQLSRLLAPFAGALDRAGGEARLHLVHVLLCLLGLAGLPFTLFFHVLASPVNLLAAAGGAAASAERGSPAGRATRRALALDACVHCGICDLRCSVAPLARTPDGAEALPSHKLVAASALARGTLLGAHAGTARVDVLPEHAIRAADGAFLCTDCGRCTEHCPVGIDLQDLWLAARRDFADVGLPGTAQWVLARSAAAWARSVEWVPGEFGFFQPDAQIAPLAAERNAFSRCVQCQTCTNVCPIVAEGAQAGLDFTPQQLMNLLRLGLGQLALGSRMVWDCATCYQCQEICPEGVRVTDIICELRALAVARLAPERARMEPA